MSDNLLDNIEGTFTPPCQWQTKRASDNELRFTHASRQSQLTLNRTILSTEKDLWRVELTRKVGSVTTSLDSVIEGIGDRRLETRLQRAFFTYAAKQLPLSMSIAFTHRPPLGGLVTLPDGLKVDVRLNHHSGKFYCIGDGRAFDSMLEAVEAEEVRGE